MFSKTADPSSMRTSAISLILIISFIWGIFPGRDPWFARDKSLHFSVSFIIYNFAYIHTGSRDKSFSITIGIGVLKELIDLTIRKTGFSYKDLLYDVLGAGLAYKT